MERGDVSDRHALGGGSGWLGASSPLTVLTTRLVLVVVLVVLALVVELPAMPPPGPASVAFLRGVLAGPAARWLPFGLRVDGRLVLFGCGRGARRRRRQRAKR